MPLGLLCDLAKHAVEIGAWVFGPDLLDHFNEAL